MDGNSPHMSSAGGEIQPRIYPRDQHSISRSEIDQDAYKVVVRLLRAGYQAYIVGGGVRDLLLGKKPKDFDISTNATPSQIKALFRNCRIIGKRFKLAHLYFTGGKIIEVSTFRDIAEWSEPSEGTTESGPVTRDNVYGTEATDALRRDLTINGLFLDVDSCSVIDYVGGMDDLQSGIVRVIGDPDVRFREDPVRMIRVVRHCARNGFQIESNTWDSLLRNRELITQSSNVRVFDEFKKDVVSGHLLNILSLLAETRLLEFVLPELLENNGRLLSADSDFSQCIERIDDLVADDHEVSPTVPLALIGLFTSADTIKLSDMSFQFEGSHDIDKKLSETFTLLAVPKRERERIGLLLHSWLKLLGQKPELIKPSSLRRVQLLPDLITLVTVVAQSREDEKLLRVLERALSQDGAGHDRPSHNRRRGR